MRIARSFTRLLALLALTLGVGLAPGVRAAEEPVKEGPVSFYRQVRPILQRNCTGCHQPAKAGGKLVLTSYAAAKTGGEQGTGFEPNKPDESLLIEVITGDKPSMPKNAPPLAKELVALIGRWIQEGAKDDTPAEVQDTISPENPPVYHSAPVISAVAWSPDNQLIAVSGFREILLHKVDGSGLAGRLIGRSQYITSLAFSPDGKLLAATGGNPALFGEVQFWNVADRKLERSATLTNDTLFGGRFSDDGALFALGGADNSARVLRVADAEQLLKFDAHADWVMGTAFSVDGKHMITISRDRSMKLSIVETGQFVDNITSITPGALKGGLMALRRHPKKDELLIGGSDGEPKLYQMIRTKARVIGDDFNRIRSYPAMAGRIFALDFSADGSKFVAGSSDGRTGQARVYSTEDGKLLHELKGHGRGVFTVAFAPDGKQVVTGGFDGRLRIFNAESGELAKEIIPVDITPAVAAAGK
ncbi:MAG TPA: c-type cytochrome domain-containing protein [Planctomycetaceae bacterium]|jgi:WD40 repeat protein|nr:c-type cytochrome domain-containing protein [Planctomycetaceae bacterium]